MHADLAHFMQILYRVKLKLCVFKCIILYVHEESVSHLN